MRTAPPSSIDEVRDPVGRRFWPTYKGRDGCRRPMQWSAPRPAAHDGLSAAAVGDVFTSGKPWLPFGPDVQTRHVQAQREDPGSVLQTWRTLLRLRRQNGALRRGSMRLLTGTADLLAYTRELDAARCLVLLNMGDGVHPMPSSLTADCAGLRPVFSTHEGPGSVVDRVAGGTLAPFQALILAGGA